VKNGSLLKKKKLYCKIRIHRIQNTVIIFQVLCAREKWFITQEKKKKPVLQVSENKVFKKISEPKEVKRSEYLQVVNKVEVYDFYRSPSIVTTVKSRRLQKDGHERIQNFGGELLGKQLLPKIKKNGGQH
jgi:hypothetical protein